MNTQSSVEETHKQESSLDSYEKLKGTPFLLICTKGTWFIGFNNRFLTGGHNTKEEAIEYIETRKWEVIMHFCIALMEKHNELIKMYGDLNAAKEAELQRLIEEFGSMENAIEALRNQAKEQD